ncbi:MAG: ABC transporter substrate-binding protein [Flavobacteriales bacterium]|nr:ABC transporter substrate-binding protein [Flavobacteriales bacterium]
MLTASIKPSFLLLFLLTVTFYSCEKGDRPISERSAKGDIRLGGCLKVAVSEPPTSFAPSEISSATASEIGMHLHDGLLKQDAKTLEIIPGLAESWSVDEAGTSYIFTLRKRANFHENECFGNGSRSITAQDFVFSFKQLCSSGESKAFETTFKNRVLGANEFHDGDSEELVGVKAVDDYTLSIQLTKPDPSFLFVLAQPSTAVVSEKAVLKYGKESKVGAGPFVFVSSGADLVLVRNDEYYSEDAFGNRFPYIDTLIFKSIATREQQLDAFFNGEIDLVSSVYPDPVKKILEQHVADFSGKNPKYIMQRETETVGYESYSINRAGIKGFGNNFMGYRDFSRVQIEQ